MLALWVIIFLSLKNACQKHELILGKLTCFFFMIANIQKKLYKLYAVKEKTGIYIYIYIVLDDLTLKSLHATLVF